MPVQKSRANYPLNNEGQPQEPQFVRAVDSAGNDASGGKYMVTPTTVADGERTNLSVGSQGQLRVELWEGGGVGAYPGQPGNTDGISPNQYGLGVAPRNLVYNGATWDRLRGDTTGAYVVPKPGTAGGLLMSRIVTGTTGVIKASAGQVFTLALYN